MLKTAANSRRSALRGANPRGPAGETLIRGAHPGDRNATQYLAAAGPLEVALP